MTEWGPSFHARPRLVVSRCLDLEPCRYDGGIITAPTIPRLVAYADLLPVCPEMAIGLGVPRDPIRLVRADGEGRRRLVQPSPGRDLTDAMERFASSFVADAGEIDGIVLKARSPSCGLADVKVFATGDDEEPRAFGAGVFAETLAAARGWVAVVDESALTAPDALDAFLTRVWSVARLRTAASESTRAALVRFHAEHKLLLLAWNEHAMRSLGTLVADAARRPIADVWQDYATGFRAALLAAPSDRGWVNALMHTLGYFRETVTANRRQVLARELGCATHTHAERSALLLTLRGWIEHVAERYLRTQAFFWPYPDALRDLPGFD